MLLKSSCITTTKFRGVVRGCAGCAIAQPDFGRSVNPISTRGTDYAHLITTGTPGFSDLLTALPCAYLVPLRDARATKCSMTTFSSSHLDLFVQQ